MDSLFPQETLDRFTRSGVIAVVVVDHPDHIVPLGRALVACGIDVIELALRTPSAVDALRLVRREVPEILAGAGTVLSAEQVDEVADAGASFAVAPGLNPSVVERARQLDLPFAPGVVTPSEVERAVEMGCRELKFFPAEPSGGIRYLRTMAAPYAHLGLQFLPLGGINAENMSAYLFDDMVPAVGGSWIATRKLIRTENWSAVIDHATEAKRIVKEMAGQ